jgi:hypothetical protein
MADRNRRGWGCVAGLAVLAAFTDVPDVLGDLLFQRMITRDTTQIIVFDAGVLATAALGLGLWRLGVRFRGRTGR